MVMIGTSVQMTLARVVLNMRGRVGVRGWLTYGLLDMAAPVAGWCEGGSVLAMGSRVRGFGADWYRRLAVGKFVPHRPGSGAGASSWAVGEVVQPVGEFDAGDPSGGDEDEVEQGGDHAA